MCLSCVKKRNLHTHAPMHSLSQLHCWMVPEMSVKMSYSPAPVRALHVMHATMRLHRRGRSNLSKPGQCASQSMA